MRDFVDCRLQLSVFDHAYSDTFLTWSNHQDEEFLARKLDRVLINAHWQVQFAHSQVEFLPLEISDHCPFII